MPKIQHSGGRATLTIPKSIMTLKGWKKGDDLIFIQDKHGVVMIIKAP